LSKFICKKLVKRRTWTLLQDEIDRLRALEMWLWRGLKKLRLSNGISNDEVLIIVNEEICLIETIIVLITFMKISATLYSLAL